MATWQMPLPLCALYSLRCTQDRSWKEVRKDEKARYVVDRGTHDGADDVRWRCYRGVRWPWPPRKWAPSS